MTKAVPPPVIFREGRGRRGPMEGGQYIGWAMGGDTSADGPARDFSCVLGAPGGGGPGLLRCWSGSVSRDRAGLF